MDTLHPNASVCRKCHQMHDADAHYCACGAPTTLASFKERSEYELKQWRAYQARLAQEQTA